MYRRATLLLGAALLGLAQAQHPILTAPPGPAPTAAPARIVKRADIEIHQEYGAPIGVDTDYLTQEGSTTKWIGVNTEYLTEETRTTNIDNVETTTVVKPQLAVVTATVASEGVAVGDVTVLISDSLQDQLNNIIKEAAASCAAPAKLRKRDSACMIRALQGAAQDDGALSLINAGEWNGFTIELAKSAPRIMRDAFQVLATRAYRNRFAIMIAAAGTAGALAAHPNAEVAHKFFFGNGQFGGENSGDNNDDDKPSTTPKPESSTTSMCDPSGTVDENSPACDDEDCKGKDKVCQADGEYKNCPCANWVQAMYEGHFDKEWADAQQQILLELEADLPDIIPPQCFRNTHGDNFAGEPRAEPSAWCHCSSAVGNGKTNGNYATLKGEGDDACTYATMPTETIELTTKPKETGPVTSCRWESSYSLDPYCTCNDDRMHGSIVTRYQGKETTVCPDATATMTELETPTAEAVSCYPTRGTLDVEEFFKFCEFSEEQLYNACDTEITDDRGVAVGCNQAIKDIYRPRPHYYNTFRMMFEKADDAPDDCDYLFSPTYFDDHYYKTLPLRTNANNALCVPVLQEIATKCSWNGGEAKNPCGTFKFQSCFREHGCKWGDPSFEG